MLSLLRFRVLTIASLLPLGTLPLASQNRPKPKKITPEQLLADGQASNGLAGLTTPWHVRATFESFDENGKHLSGGVFEESWYGPKSYRITYTTDTLNQTDVATEQGLFRSGDQRWATYEEYEPAHLLLQPLSVRPYDPEFDDLRLTNIGVAESKLNCVAFDHRQQHLPSLTSHESLPAPPPDTAGLSFSKEPSICFDPTVGALRSRSSGFTRVVTVFNDIAQFGGHMVARHIQRADKGKQIFELHVTELNALPAGSAPPVPAAGSSGPLQGPIDLPEGRMMVASGERDFFDAVMHTIPSNSTVTAKLKVSIDETGRVLDVAILDGPPQFAAVVARAMRKKRYIPFTIEGQPVKVNYTDSESFGSVTSVGIQIIK